MSPLVVENARKDFRQGDRVVTALAKTLEIQQEIDELYPQVEKDVVPIFT